MSRLSAAALLAISCLSGPPFARHAFAAAASANGASPASADGQLTRVWGERRRSSAVDPSLPEILPVRRPGEGGSGSVGGADVVEVATTPAECSETAPKAGSSGDGSNRDVSLTNVNEEDVEEEEWRSSLPPQLRRRRGTLRHMVIPPGAGDDEGCELYLLGTSHVSRDSCDDARLLVEHVRPHCLFIELCPQRLALLSDDAAAPPPSASPPSSNERGASPGVAAQAKELQARNPGMTRASALSASLLTKIQGDYATKLGVTIGGEFRESCEVARRQQRAFESALWKRRYEAHIGARSSAASLAEGGDLHGCSVVLGDRPVRLTLVRAWESLSVLGKVRLVLGLIWSSFRQPSEKELREWMDSIINDPGNDLLSKSIEELGKHFPTIREVIIHERDRYMAAKLLQTARLLENIPSTSGQQRRRIVAVVGAGHCPGMCQLLQDGEAFQDQSLEEVLRSVVETKRSTVDNSDDTRLLTSEVTELQIS